jgi:hypothetical protein
MTFFCSVRIIFLVFEHAVMQCSQQRCQIFISNGIEHWYITSHSVWFGVWGVEGIRRLSQQDVGIITNGVAGEYYMHYECEGVQLCSDVASTVDSRYMIPHHF